MRGEPEGQEGPAREAPGIPRGLTGAGAEGSPVTRPTELRPAEGWAKPAGALRAGRI